MDYIFVFCHFLLMYTLELRVKKYTIRMKLPAYVEMYSLKRLRLFLLITILAITPVVITMIQWLSSLFFVSHTVLVLNISSAVFGLYFCACKFLDKKYVESKWVITVPSPTLLTKMLSALGFLIIATVFISGYHLIVV